MKKPWEPVVWRSTDTGGIASSQLISTRNIEAGQTVELRLPVDVRSLWAVGHILHFSYIYEGFSKSCIGNVANFDI